MIDCWVMYTIININLRGTSFPELVSHTLVEYTHLTILFICLTWKSGRYQYIGNALEKNIQKVLKELIPPLYFFLSKIQIILAYFLFDSRPRFQHTLKCNYLFCFWFNLMLSAITMHLQFQNIFFYLYYLHDLYKFCSCFDFYNAKHHYCLSKKKKILSYLISRTFNHRVAVQSLIVLIVPLCIGRKTMELVVCCWGCLFENIYSLSTFPSVYFFK